MAKKIDCPFNKMGLLETAYKGITSNKEDIAQAYLAYMLSRSQEIFKWSNLPETIPAMDLELLIQRDGFAIIAKVNEDYYAFRGGLGGQRNAYYRPTIATVSNPYLDFNENLTIGKDCEIILNDPFYLGLLPLFQMNAEQQAETDISLRFAEINSRIEAFLIADTDKGKADAERVLKKIVDGKELGVIGDKALFDGIKSIAYSGRPAGNIKELIELKQYFKSSWFIDMGLNSAFNMKREAINESESQMGVDALLPLIHQLLKQRKAGAERVNKLFGLNISVDLSEIWKNAEKDTEREPENTKPEQKKKTNETLPEGGNENG